MESAFIIALKMIKSDIGVITIIAMFSIVTIIKFFPRKNDGKVVNKVNKNKKSKIDITSDRKGDATNTLEENEGSTITISN